MKKPSQTDVQEWWTQNPMTYGATHGDASFSDGSFEMGTLAFFNRVDQEFYSWNRPLHDQKPFDRLFPYEKFQNKKVLEIGCGLGTMLLNWAKNGSYCTAIDLNATSVEQTKKRFALQGLSADIRREDARKLPFKDNQFDYVWSWGVLHHSPDLETSIKELFRVLKPGGEFGLMLYNRKSFYQWYVTDFVEGFLHLESQFLNPLELNSRYGDGHKEEGNPHTWPITRGEGLRLLAPYSKNASVKILGTDLDFVLRLMVPGFKGLIPLSIVKAFARRWGWSLWFSGTKDL